MAGVVNQPPCHALEGNFTSPSLRRYIYTFTILLPISKYIKDVAHLLQPDHLKIFPNLSFWIRYTYGFNVFDNLQKEFKHCNLYALCLLLKGLPIEIWGGSKVISIDSSRFGLWLCHNGFARNTATILKVMKNILAQYNTRMYNCWVTLKACWKLFSACS